MTRTHRKLIGRVMEGAGLTVTAVGTLLLSGVVYAAQMDKGAFAIWIWLLAFLTTVVTGLAVMFTGEVVAETARRGYCPQCDYDLRGQREGGCPECGWSRTAR